MRARSIVVIGVVCIGALGFLWPSLLAGRRAPLVGDWCPETDPGTIVAEVVAGRRVEFLVGRRYHGARGGWRAANGDLGLLETSASTLKSGVPDQVVGRSATSLSSWMAVGGGYDAAQLFEFEFAAPPEPAVKCAAYAPVRLEAVPPAAARPIARFPERQFSVEYLQSREELLVRIVVDGARTLESVGGEVRVVGDAGAAARFEASVGALTATVPLARLQGWVGLDTNTCVEVEHGGGHSGVRVTVTLLLP